MATEKGKEQSSNSHPWKYDVFLSCTSDNTFVYHLYSTLCQVGINTFRACDDDQLSDEGTRAVEAIVLESPVLKDVPLNTKTFEKMAKLRVLQINHVQLYGSFQYLPESLKCLRWYYCPLKCLPSDFCLENLVILDMSYSKFNECQAPLKQPERSLSQGGYLPSSFSSLSALKVLQIENCNLSEDDIPFSLASLSSLQSLCFRKNKFHAIPFNLSDLSSLKYLNLSECPNLKTIPEVPLTLQKLIAYKCKLLERLPNLSDLKRLEELVLDRCEMLAEIQGLENLDSVRRVYLWSCKTFGRTLDVSNLSQLKNLDLSQCERLIEIRGLENNHSIRYINLFNCKALENPFTEDFFKAHYEHGRELQLGLCSSKVPDWFSYQVDGRSICFNMPLQVESTFLGMFLWIVYGTVDETKNVYPKATIIDLTNGVEFNHRLWTTISFAENSSIHYIPPDYFKCPVKGRERMSIHIECYDFPTEDFVKKCGVHLLYKDKNGQVHSVSVSSPCFDSENEVTINHSRRE
ncbi:hypothetical protein RND71_036794 [Anisodus tanguticus]|uniref:Disease resistance R13L4/SHOC-2-like LRR domain-containing protein n=1 Tax=Anisodus tanguticus TaxID=243964 RepID=A0AAE1R1N7_9SOLA|nr:hypothetical protein RND71_036794 [Anisodus tanguticus]